MIGSFVKPKKAFQVVILAHALFPFYFSSEDNNTDQKRNESNSKNNQVNRNTHHPDKQYNNAEQGKNRSFKSHEIKLLADVGVVRKGYHIKRILQKLRSKPVLRFRTINNRLHLCPF